MGERSGLYLLTGGITQNTSALSFAIRGVNAKKPSTTSRVTELRLKIKYSRRKLIYRYTQIDSNFSLAEKNVDGLQKIA